MSNSEDESEKKTAKLPPFTSEEKEILLEIVNKPSVKAVVENKRTNAVWTAQKKDAWDSVSTEFCSHISVVKRTGAQLKKGWENLKSRCKKQISKKKRGRGKTGGGSKENSLFPTSYKVAAIVPAQMTSLDNKYDDDADSAGSGVELGFDEWLRRRNQKDAAKQSTVEIEATAVVPPTDCDDIGCTNDTTVRKVMCSKTKQLKPQDRKRKLLAGHEIIISLEEELQAKKLKLLDRQIEREEKNIAMDEEFYTARMKLISLQIEKSKLCNDD